MSDNAARADTGFFGHPKGLGYLAFTETWERFSYYGMTALLALYMVQQLLTPGHAELVLGLGGLRRLFEFRGALTDKEFASLIFGWYSGLVYFTPILGGLIADRWLGAERTVVLGALLMSAGHIAMAFGAVPASWFNSVDAFASIVAVPPLVALWRWQAKRAREPGYVAKIGIGAALTGVSALVLAAGSLTAGADGRFAVWWPLVGFAGMGVAFLYFWPVLLALISQAAPAKVNATLMGGAFLSLFAGSVLMGWVGSFYDRMTPAAFWMLDAGIGFVGAALIALLAQPLTRALEPVKSSRN